jgi:putative aldouronate transport system permease protein
MKANENSIKDSKEDRVFGFIVDILLIIIGVMTIFPLIFVLSASVSDPVMVNSGQVLLLPKGFNLDGYKAVFENTWVLTGYRNSLIYTVAGTFLNVLVTFMAAYSLSRKDMYGHKIITIYMVFTMWFGGGLIPTFLVINKIGLVNRPIVMVILGLISIYNCIICRSFISSSIPIELQEAARIDGCNDFGILWKIVFPLSKPVLAILCLYYALGHWNGYFNALIYLDNRNYQPLQIFLREILIENTRVTVDDSIDLEAMVRRTQMAQVMKYSLIVVASLPMLAIYPFVQKFFVKGVMIGSIKG